MKPIKPFEQILSITTILCLAWLSTGCTGIATLPAATPSTTATAVSSATPTETFIPTETETLEPVPTSTLLVPTPVLQRQFRLTNWTPAKADALIKSLESYPDTLSYYDQGYLDSVYYWVYHFAAEAQAEAAARFPNAPQAPAWRWGILIDRIKARMPVGSVISDLLLQALDRHEVDLTGLTAWFDKNAPDLSLELTPLKPPAGYTSSQIVMITIKSDDFGIRGGTYLWLLQQSSTFTIYSFETENDFYLADGQYSLDLKDVTGDSIPEVIIDHSDWLQGLQSHLGSLDIYDVSQYPPKKLNFSPLPDAIDLATVSAYPVDQKSIGIALQIPTAPEAGHCGVFGPTFDYHWDGKEFILDKLLPPAADELTARPYCANYLTQEFMDYAGKDIPAALEVFDEFAQGFPYEVDSNDSIQTRAELRFRLGIILADQGDVKEARREMQLILSDPESRGSPFATAASQFLDDFHTPPDLLQTCLAVHRCSPALGLDELVNLLPVGQFNESVDLMKQMGVEVPASGTFDFDGDGQPENWFFTNPEYPSFEILELSSGKIKLQTPIINVGSGNEFGTIRIKTLPPQGDIHPWQLTNNGVPADPPVMYSWSEGVTDFPLSDYDMDNQLNTIEDDLFSGSLKPANAIVQLDTYKNRSSLCNDTFEPGLWCTASPHLGYLLGLAYELNGQKDQAVQAYLEVWKDHPDSIYAVMASAKLEPIP